MLPESLTLKSQQPRRSRIKFPVFSLWRVSHIFPVQRRRGSKDAAGDEKSEWERRLDKPSVPLKAIGDPGPPKIVEIQEKYGAVEGEQQFTFSQEPDIKLKIICRSNSLLLHVR